jgi:hypothetical protein
MINNNLGREVIITEHIEQLSKGQDYTISGETIYENQKEYDELFLGSLLYFH